MKNNSPLAKSYPQDSYFASLSGTELSAAVMDRVVSFYTQLPRTLQFYNWTKTYNAYYGLPGDFDPFAASQVGQAGSQGKLATVRVPHIASIGKTMVRMTTETPPEFEPHGINSDTQTDEQVLTCKAVLNYLMDGKQLAKKIREALETGVIFGDGPLLVQFDPNLGTPQTQQGVDPVTGQATKVPTLLPNGKQKRSGDFVFTNLTPLDLVRDPTLTDQDDDWVITRVYVNKHNYIVRFPEWKQQLLDATDQRWPGYQTNTLETERQYRIWPQRDRIPLYILWHRKTEALPRGKYAIVLESGTKPLIEGDLPYSKIPVVNFSPGHIIRTTYGTSDLHLGLGLSDLMESSYSAIASNNLAFALQLIAAPRTADYGLSQLTEGLNLVEYDADPNLPNGGLPVGINLHKDSPSAGGLVDRVIRDLEIITGVNAVSRGQAPTSDASGALAALIQQQSITQTSPIMVAYQQGISDVGNLIVEMINTYASGDQVAEIVGSAGQYSVLNYQGGPQGDMSSIHRVTVKSGNPAKRTDAQKLQLTQMVAQAKGADITAADIISIYETGDVEQALEGPESHLLQLRAENELMRQGVNPPVLKTDNHANHIDEMMAVMNSPQVRGPGGDKISNAALGHLMDHLRIWAQMSLDGDPILFATHQQPMPKDIALKVPGVQPPPEPPPAPVQPPPPIPLSQAGVVNLAGGGAPQQPPPPPANPNPAQTHGGPVHVPNGVRESLGAPPQTGHLPNQPQMPKVAGTNQHWAPGQVAKP